LSSLYSTGHTKTNTGQVFFRDKGPNIISRYDFWTITTFTSLKLSLKIVIFWIFVQCFVLTTIYFDTIRATMVPISGFVFEIGTIVALIVAEYDIVSKTLYFFLLG
jgi:hypothetical protein